MYAGQRKVHAGMLSDLMLGAWAGMKSGETDAGVIEPSFGHLASIAYKSGLQGLEDSLCLDALWTKPTGRTVLT